MTGLQIQGPGDKGPSKLKIFANKESLDFDSAKTAKPTQELKLQKGNVLEGTRVALVTAKFNIVHALTILVVGNFGEEEETVINSLAVWGNVIEIKTIDMRTRDYVPKWTSDKGVDDFDKSCK